jgi:hypothetical protein
MLHLTIYAHDRESSNCQRIANLSDPLEGPIGAGMPEMPEEIKAKRCSRKAEQSLEEASTAG